MSPQSISPIAALLTGIILTLVFSLFIPRIEVESDGIELLDPNHFARVADAGVNALFQQNKDLLLVVGPYNWRSAVKSASPEPYVWQVSLAVNADFIKRFPSAKPYYQISPLSLRPGKGSPFYGNIAALWQHETLSGILISRDGQGIASALKLPSEYCHEEITTFIRTARELYCEKKL